MGEGFWPIQWFCLAGFVVELLIWIKSAHDTHRHFGQHTHGRANQVPIDLRQVDEAGMSQ